MFGYIFNGISCRCLLIFAGYRTIKERTNHMGKKVLLVEYQVSVWTSLQLEVV